MGVGLDFERDDVARGAGRGLHRAEGGRVGKGVPAEEPEPDRKAKSDVDTPSQLDAFIEVANGRLSRVNRRIDIFLVDFAEVTRVWWIRNRTRS